jgi:hypothetical protein
MDIIRRAGFEKDRKWRFDKVSIDPENQNNIYILQLGGTKTTPYYRVIKKLSFEAIQNAWKVILISYIEQWKLRSIWYYGLQEKIRIRDNMFKSFTCGKFIVTWRRTNAYNPKKLAKLWN